MAGQKSSAVANSSGLEVHYDVFGDLGSGQTALLVLHGAYMTADAMAPFVEEFARSRPVVAVDQRGHGRTPDAEGPITYEALADDAAAVLDAARLAHADALGYSMGAAAVMQLAIRHPDKVAKLVSVSGAAHFDAMYPELIAGIAEMSPDVFEGSPIKSEYERLAPRPQDFPLLVEKLKELDATPYDWMEAMRAIPHRTMLVQGDYDMTSPQHGAELFHMRDTEVAPKAAQGWLTDPPPARLLVLPGTSHLGVMAQAELVVKLVTRFLDDATEELPAGFF